MQKRFDEWLYEDIGKDRYGSGKTESRIDNIISKNLKEKGERFVKDAVEAVSKRLEQTLNESLKNKIGETIASKIGLERLLPQIVSENMGD